MEDIVGFTLALLFCAAAAALGRDREPVFYPPVVMDLASCFPANAVAALAGLLHELRLHGGGVRGLVHAGSRRGRQEAQGLSRRCTTIAPTRHPSESCMSRLSINLSEARRRTLKQAAVQRSKVIGRWIDASLGGDGFKSRAGARDPLRRLQAHMQHGEAPALVVADGHVHAVRAVRMSTRTSAAGR